jgi:very-long-chain enoyl-CoA reductase
MVSITIQTRGGKPSKKFPITLEVNDLDKFNIAQLKQQISSKSKLSVHRQRLTTSDKKVLDDDDKTLAQLGIKQGEILEIKDLGPQICSHTSDLSVS